MAKRKVFLFIGSSNMQGSLALLKDVPFDDFNRWTGTAAPPGAPTQSYQRPFHITVPGVRFYTIRFPYSLNERRTVTLIGGGGLTLTYNGADVDTDDDQWIYVPETVADGVNSTAQGQLRRVTGQGVNTVDIASAIADLAVGDSICMLLDSHTVGAVDNAYLGHTPALPGFENVALTKITRTGTTAAFTASDVGRFVFFPEDAAPPAYHTSRILQVIGDDQIVLDHALPAAITAVGKMFVVCAGANASHGLATMQPPNAVMQDMTFFTDEKGPVYLTGVDYSNYIGYPYPAPKVAAGGIVATDAPIINCIPELTWSLRNLFQQPLDCISLGIGGSLASTGYRHAITFAPQGAATIGQAAHLAGGSWIYETHGIDWNPGGDSNLYQALVNTINGIRTLLAAEGHEPDFDCTFINLADNDQGLEARQTRIGENHRIIRDAIRVATGNPRMKFIMAGPSTYGKIVTWSGDVRDSTYAQLKKVADDDAFTAYIDTRKPEYGKAPDGEHYNAAGQIQLGKDFFIAYEALTKRANDAARLAAELPSLATLRTRVRRRYERTDSGNSVTASRIDMFINDSVSEIVNTLGDTAWFMRRVEDITLSPSFPGTILLPRVVRRILRIESAQCPGRSVVYKGIAYTDEGRVQITLHDFDPGPYKVHFIAPHLELVADTDLTMVPPEHIELIVMLTCKRIAENSGNAAVAQYYMIETERLWRGLKREALRFDRFRQAQLEGMVTYDSWRGGTYPSGPMESL